MTRPRFLPALVLAIVVVIVASGRPRAEVVDEIVAKINDDIVTKSDLDSEEQGILQELYRNLSGTQLDEQVAKAKKLVLRQLIDRRVLLQQASHLFDTSKMKDFYLQQFMNQQGIKNEKDLEKMLTQEGMTLADWKQKLVEYFAPKEVLRAEVADHIAISEADVRAYYDAHGDDYEVPAQATVREIVVTSGTDAEAARARANAAHDKVTAPGADFAALAGELSEAGTKSSGGLLGTIKKGDLAAPLEEASFSLPVGSVSPVIEVEGNFFILKVDARNDAGRKPFDDVKDEVETKIRNQKFDAESKVYLQKAWSQATIWISPKYEARLAPQD